ncbi:unnamed protein product, partial [Amoebophrya sp. A120]
VAQPSAAPTSTALNVAPEEPAERDAVNLFERSLRDEMFEGDTGGDEVRSSVHSVKSGKSRTSSRFGNLGLAESLRAHDKRNHDRRFNYRRLKQLQSDATSSHSGISGATSTAPG